jgi:hypothetical protein
MKLLNYVPFLLVFALSILSGCQGAISSSETPQTKNSAAPDNRELNPTSEIPEVESNVRIDNPKLNRAIETYIDKYLSEIIRIRNFNPERVSKVFCVHKTGYIEAPTTAPDFLHVYVKLLCVEAIPAKGGLALPIFSGASIGNPTSIISKISVFRSTKSVEESFRVYSDETPRRMPESRKDLARIIPSTAIYNKVHGLKSNDKADYLQLQKKADEYQKKKAQNCK